MIEFRKMTREEYLQFRGLSISKYAKDLMNGEGLDCETALKNAGNEFDGTLPDGADSGDQFVMIIRDALSGKEVG